MTEPATIPPSELLANLRQNTSDKVLALASHAALPVVVDAGFVNLLRVNFFLDPPDELPFEAEADLLLSPMCREIGDELYELDPAVRNLLLIMLQSRYGAERVRQVALLLEQYTQSTPTWTAQPELEQAQQLTALSFVDPARAQAWLDDAQTGAKAERLSPDWYIAMRSRLAARPPATAAQDELARAMAALEDDNARIRLAAVNTLAVLSQLPGTDLTEVIEALARMLRSRAKPSIDRIGRDVQAALTLIGTLPREERPIDLSGIWLSGADLRNLNLSRSRLAEVSLFDCRADGISLAGADLYSADLVDVTANEGNLHGAILTAARLLRVSLRGASLVGTWLDGGHLNQVDFSDANLTNASMPTTIDNLVQRDVIFSGANLKNAQFPMGSFEILDSPPTPEDSTSSTSTASADRPSEQLAERLDWSGNLDEAVAVAEDSPSLASALVGRTERHIAVGDTDSARRDIDEAVEIYRELSATDRSLYLPDLARSLSILATVITDDQSATLARAFDESIALYREAGPAFRSGLALTLLNQARWLLRLTRLPEASAAAEQARDLFTGDASLAACFQTLGDIEALRANYNEAASDYGSAIHHAQAAGDLPAEGIAHYRQGDALRRLGQSDAALDSLTAATEIFQAITDVPWEAISLRTTGQLLDKAGRPADAVQVLRTALTRFQSLNDTQMSALTMSDLGNALLEDGQPTTAVGILQDALGIIRRQDYPQAEATTLQRLGLALRSVGRTEEAVEALQEATNIFYGIDDTKAGGQALDLIEQIRLDELARFPSQPNRALARPLFYLVCDASGALAETLNSALIELLATPPRTTFTVWNYLSVITYSNSVHALFQRSTVGDLEPNATGFRHLGTGACSAVW